MYDPKVAAAVYLRSQPPRLVPEAGQSSYIEADLHYFESTVDGEQPYNRRYPSETLPASNMIFSTHRERIYDLRKLVDQGRADETSIDKTGFAIIPAETAKTVMKESDYESEETICTTYYDETIALVKKVTGASRVEIFDHTIRRSDAVGPDTVTNRMPVAQVHVDQTPSSGRRRVERHCPADAEKLLAGKASLINVWRLIRDGGNDKPLSYADARSLSDGDLIPARLIFQDPTPEGETYRVKYNARHRFYFLSNMSTDEAIFLQCWNNDSSAAKTPHSGVINEKEVGKGLPRRSIEVRCLVFWD